MAGAVVKVFFSPRLPEKKSEKSWYDKYYKKYAEEKGN